MSTVNAPCCEYVRWNVAPRLSENTYLPNSGKFLLCSPFAYHVARWTLFLFTSIILNVLSYPNIGYYVIEPVHVTITRFEFAVVLLNAFDNHATIAL